MSGADDRQRNDAAHSDGDAVGDREPSIRRHSESRHLPAGQKTNQNLYDSQTGRAYGARSKSRDDGEEAAHQYDDKKHRKDVSCARDGTDCREEFHVASAHRAEDVHDEHEYKGERAAAQTNQDALYAAEDDIDDDAAQERG